MSWHDFIFSERKAVRFLRHATFWLAWWIFYSSTTFSWWIINIGNLFSKNPGLVEAGFEKWASFVLAKSFFFLIIHLLSCYAFIYVVLPGFLLKKNYVKLAAGIFVISIFLLVTGYLIQSSLLPLIRAAYHLSTDTEKNTVVWSAISTGLLNAPKVIAVATIIKILKRWWLKQKEKERLEKEKMATELELLKTQIHPQFLFNSLDNIYFFALKSSPKAPEMLIRLSDILSYMLYECDDAIVPLVKEIKMIRDYMSLEQIRYGDKLEMNIQVRGEVDHYFIAPLLLLCFVENSFNHSRSSLVEQPWINLEINVENECFYMKLIHGKSLNSEMLSVDIENGLASVQKRLKLLYPGNHEIKIVEEPEIFMVNLQVNLQSEANSKPGKRNETMNDQTSPIMSMSGI